MRKQHEINKEELREEMRLYPNKENSYEAVMARNEAYTNGDMADIHGVILQRR